MRVQFRFRFGLGLAVLGTTWTGSVPAAEEVGRQPLPNGLQCVQQSAAGAGGVVRFDTAVQNPTDRAQPLGEVRLRQRTLDVDLGLEGGRYQRLTYRRDTWYGSTYWTGPNWTRVGKDWHHPGEQTPSVRRFRVPRDGRVTIAGRVFKLHQSGDGIRAAIRHNDREVWHAEIDGADGQGVEPNLTLDVRQGDALRFVVHKRGQIFCDTTGWDPQIRYADGESFTASTAFAAEKQGAGGWWYEMEADAAATAGWPQVYAFARDAALVVRAVRIDQPVEWSEREAFPLVVIANAKDSGGIALATTDDQPWSIRVSLDSEGQAAVVLAVRPPAAASVAAGQNAALPPVWEGVYQGSWIKGLGTLLHGHDEPSGGPALTGLQKRVAAWLPGPPLTLDLWAMIQADWRRQDGIDDTVASLTRAVEQQRQADQRLLADQQADYGSAHLAPESHELERLAAGLRADAAVAEVRTQWLALRALKRRMMLAHPLLDFGPLLICQRVPPSWSHLVAQYFGWRQRPGGGLYVLDQPGRTLAVRDILRGQLPPGNILEPRLSYDGQRILFSFVPCSSDVPDPARLPVNEQGDESRYFHLYEVRVDGTGLRQLTHGTYDDMMGEYLPDGDLVFCSTRRKGYSRCFGPEYSYRWHSYTLHRMDADGDNIRTLSYNDVSEWFPAVLPNGLILHARWDYIDRDAVTHQNLWAVRPDGTNPIAVWGNATPKPHCSFQAKPIPGSHKLVFIAAAHHAITAGPLCVVDPTVDPNSQDAVRRLTPGPFPESEAGEIPEYYEAPWPLSEKLFLVAYSADRLRFQGEHMHNPNPDNALGVYVLDAAGNRELLYRDPDISSTNPTPLRPRPRPAVLPSLLAAGPAGTERGPKSALPSVPGAEPPPQGELIVSDVYQGLGAVPRGTIKHLRVIQIFPKTTWIANQPRMGIAGEENGRAILGTVPVEADGSARFLAPAGKPLLFQALDADGLAYQTMRSLTYLQPGERIACIGCHEHRMQAPPPASTLALRRPPSLLEPGELGGRPFSFVEMVQPVLDQRCVKCHGGEKTEGGVDLTGTPHNGYTRSYWALCQTPPPEKAGAKPNRPEAWVPCFPQRNQLQLTPPGGAYGARGSRLLQLLRAGPGHYDVQLTPRDLERLGAWIDCNALFYGVYDPAEQAKQLRGEPVALPEIQ